MSNDMAILSGPAVPPEDQTFAAGKGISRYLGAVIDLARQALPSSGLCVSPGQDAEDEARQYIALDVGTGGRPVAELLAGQRIWSGGIGGVCPPRQAVYFVMGTIIPPSRGSSSVVWRNRRGRLPGRWSRTFIADR